MLKSLDVNKDFFSTEHNLKAAVTVDNVIFGYDQGDLKVLTIDCNTEPYVGMISLLGEFVKEDESLDQAAKRIVRFCTGNDDIYLEEVHSFSDPERHPFGRVITVAFYSLVSISQTRIKDAAHRHLQWVSVKNIKEMAFDHMQILDVCLNQLRNSLRNKPIGFELLPKKFSLRQLQSLYEVVLDIKLDKRNFRRKLRSLNILIDLDEWQQEVSHRPAKLYKFDEDAFQAKQLEGLKFEI